jgi:peptidoglycan hydrolase-like protein with peptidoglycan-binding domain
MTLYDVAEEVRKGNYCHHWASLEIQHGLDTLELFVSADALKVEHHGRWVRPSANPQELSVICQLLGAVAPTPYIMDRRYAIADSKNHPSPKLYPSGVGMSTAEAMIAHSDRVNLALETPSSAFVGNAGKHWVFPLEREELYGWHVETDAPTWRGIKLHDSYYGHGFRVVQPRSKAHAGTDPDTVENTHEDYAMTILLVADECYWNGNLRKTLDVYRDPRAIPLVWGGERAPKPPNTKRKYTVLKRGMRGPRVKLLQERLISLGLDLGRWGADGVFGPCTEHAVKQFQKRYGRPAETGYVLEDEYDLIMHCTSLPEPMFPPLPKCQFLYMSNQKKQKLFGEIKFKWAPTDRAPEDILITNDFISRNVIRCHIPQLQDTRIANAPRGGLVYVNKRVAKQLLAFFADLEKQNLMKHVLTWDGLGYPRLKRGYRSNSLDALSSHSWYTAFDINCRWNGMGAEPAEWNEHGTVKPLVGVAYKHGIGWGGTFRRKDGMHFSVWKLMNG